MQKIQSFAQKFKVLHNTLYWVCNLKSHSSTKFKIFAQKFIYTISGAMRKPSLLWQSYKSHCLNIKIKFTEPPAEINFCERQKFENVNSKPGVSHFRPPYCRLLNLQVFAVEKCKPYKTHSSKLLLNFKL